MKRKIVWLVVSGLMVLSLLAASCAPAVEEKPAAPAEEPEAPAKEVAPAVEEKPAAPAAEMVKVSLKKLDGTAVEKLVEKPRYGGELTIMRGTAITGWDEAYISSWALSSSLSATHEELLEGDWARGPGGTDEVTWNLPMWFDLNYYIGGLAESWEIKLPETMTYHIRKGVKWALNPASEASRLVGGRELTADDIVWNIKRVFFDIKTSGAYGVAGPSRPIDAYAPDKYTVVAKSAEGQIWPCFQYVSSWMRVFPPEVIKKYGDAMQWDRSIGNGPFMVTDYVPMSQVTYTRNPNYWKKDQMFPENQLPYVDSVKLLIIPDLSTRMSAMRTGKVDVSEPLIWEDAASLKKTSPQLKYIKHLGSSIMPGGRQDKPELPFKDIRVRRALMMAINNEEIKDTFYGGEAEVFAYPVTTEKEWARAYTPLEELPLAPDGFDTRKIYGYYPEEAKQLLAEAGYPNGFKTKTVLTSTSVDVASIVKAYWAKIGVDLTLDVKESSVFVTMQVRKTHEEILWGGYANRGLPEGLWPDRTGNAFNWAMPNDPEIDRRYDLMAALEPRTDEWWKTVKDTNIYVVHRINYFVTPQPYNWAFWQPWLKRYQGETDTGVSNGQGWYRYIWIDQELKKARGR